MSPPLRTLLEIVVDGAAVRAEPVLTFVEVKHDGSLAEERRSYAELLDNGCRIAGALEAAGMAAGDAFAIVMRNHPEFVDAMIGSEVAGTVFVPIDPRTRGDKLAYMLRFARCRGAIVSPEVVENLRPLLADLPDLEWVWVIGVGGADGRFESFADVVRASPPATAMTPRRLADPMQLLFTSGTTGDPKAIVASHARFAGVAALGPMFGLRPDDRLYTGLSLTHANAQFITLSSALAMQVPLVISRQFTKSLLWEIVTRYNCTTFNLLGGMATAIFAEPPGPLDRAHRVRFVLSAGMPAAMWRPFEERFGTRIFEFFGTAEGGLTLNPPAAGPVGSIGRAEPGLVCEILLPDDSIARAGTLGEICFRNADGSVTPVTYFGNEQASAVKTRNGWFRSGDIGWKDAAGWLFFSHRAGQSIRRNGDFIDAREVEAAIANIPGVLDAYVYGVATASNTPGEKQVVAALVVSPGLVEPREIFADCASKLGSTGVPNFVQMVAEIPKTASEKPQDRHLIAMLNEGRCQLFDRNGPAELTFAHEA
ncbi:AMP-binding protein [Chelatococcus reniformis]|uniref:ATP-dependent acyl-CoA ligase n=1 Tax=Chelatococcus reniformis TaxID=1494448 RepID=A0A916X7X0_9HYPH|nr:AMP-binding protein [Chelatococcus reniformis]GGC52741.1 ATP-dependent acyl-CoA ligase [Chelatococcus reniformis]